MNPKRTVQRTRLYTVLGIIGLASIIFLCFQLFSAEVLSLQNKDETRKFKTNIIDAELAKDDLIRVHDKDCIRGKGADCKLQINMQEEINPKFKWVQAEEDLENEDEKVAVDIEDRQKGNHDNKREEEVELLNYPRGIPYGLRDKYKPDAQAMFTCLHSKVKIPFSHVNDDYCDCQDLSDEPGTSACPDTKFYCQFQLSWSNPRWVSSSLVNDGVCDCCDGSDEWANLPLPDHVKISDEKNAYHVRQVPCQDNCDEVKAQIASNERLRQEGRKLQKEYIEFAKQMKNPGQLYGPNGVFYKLSLNCYEMQYDKYYYRVCPFSKVEQRDGPKTTVIGRLPSWGVHSEDKYKLRMSNGDSMQCPQKRPRTTVINFKCGLEDKILSVHEFEVCEYMVEFNTPAAC